MTHFTPHDLLLYQFNELSLPREEAIEDALETDIALRETWDQLQLDLEHCLNVRFQPEDAFIASVLRHLNVPEKAEPAC